MAKQQKEYKILSQKDKWYSGKFSPETLENAINAYAEEGWMVIAAFSADIPGVFSANRNEAIVIMERDCK